MKTRLSRKAQEAAGDLAATLDESIRVHASLLAEADHKEFADERHVLEAFRLVILKIAAKFEVPQ